MPPWPEGPHIQPEPGEDERVDKVLNALVGTVYIDPAAGKIVKIHGNLLQELEVVNRGLTFYKLDFTLAQKPGDVRGQKLEARANYWGWEKPHGWKWFTPWIALPRDKDKEYILHFSCGK